METSVFDIPFADVTRVRIFPLLSLKDLFSLRCVSFDMKNLVDEFFTTAESFDFTANNTSKAFTISTQYNNGRIQKLVLSQCKNWITEPLLIPVLKKNNRLSELDLSDCSTLREETLKTLTSCCKQLRKVSFSSCSLITKDSFLDFVQKCSELEEIDVERCWSIDDVCISAMCKFCPKLRVLNVSKVYSLTSVSFDALKTCSNLEILKMKDIWRLTDFDVRKILEYCHKLKVFNIIGCNQITDGARIRMKQKNIDFGDANFSFNLVSLSSPTIHLQTFKQEPTFQLKS